MKGIETTYHGTKFRSRLEAAWAAFFDIIEWRWEYEPFDLAGYIPDFIVLGQEQFLVDVKPLGSLLDLQARADALMPKIEPPSDFCVVGVAPLVHEHLSDRCVLGAGVEYHDGAVWGEPAAFWGEAAALLHRCGKCGVIGWHHELGSWYGRPCGHAEGDHFLDPLSKDDWRDYEVALDLWHEAKTTVRWSGRTA